MIRNRFRILTLSFFEALKIMKNVIEIQNKKHSIFEEIVKFQGIINYVIYQPLQ